MEFLENLVALFVTGVALYAQVPMFSSLLLLLLLATAGIAYAAFRFRPARKKPFIRVLRRSFVILGIVLLICAIPGFFFACRGTMNEICLFLAAPFLGGGAIVLLPALLLLAAEAAGRSNGTESLQPPPTPRR